MSAANANAVELKGVTFMRGERSIFNNIDIVIPRGKVTAIMGPSGCGKTTLLRLIAAQLRPNSGEVWVAGTNLPTLSRRGIRRNRSIRHTLTEWPAIPRGALPRERAEG